MNITTLLPTTVDPSYYTYETRIGLACVWILVSILGLVGNSLVIWSVILSKKLRTVTNVFVVNLSVADFWTSLSYPWICVALLSHGSWPLESEVPCIIGAVQFYTGLGASLYSLASIALNRMMLITQSMDTYRWWYSPRKVTAMIAVTWVIPCVVFFLPPILGVGAFGYDPTSHTCSDKDGHARGPEFNLIQSLGLYPVPMLIIVCSYTALYIHLKRHFRKQRNSRCSQTIPRSSGNILEGSSSLTRVGSSTTSESVVRPSRPEAGGAISTCFNNDEDPELAFRHIIANHLAIVTDGNMSVRTVEDEVIRNSGQTQDEETTSASFASVKSSGNTIRDSYIKNQQAISRQQLVITLNLFLVFCIFTLLVSPYFISLAVPSSRKFALYGATITILNSCVNPIIYAVNHPQFKVVLRKMIRCRFSEIPEPSDFLKSILSLRGN